MNARGVQLGNSIQVSSIGTNVGSAPTIAMDNDGQFVIVWDSFDVSNLRHLVFARRYAADGTPLDDQPFPVSQLASAAATRPSVAMNSGGDFCNHMAESRDRRGVGSTCPSLQPGRATHWK